MAYHLQQHADAIYEDLHQKMEMNIAPRVSIVISENSGDSVDGGAMLAYRPIIILSVNQYAPYELRSSGSTAEFILRHELVHIFAGRYYPDEFIPWLSFGYPPFSNTFAPDVFHEGYAQWYESDSTTGNGRALRHNPLGEGLWRQEFAQGFRDYRDVFEPVGRNEGILGYLYGAYFFTYVSERFGEQAIADLLKARAQYTIFSMVNLSWGWDAAFGEPLATTWAQFIQFESNRLSELVADPEATAFTTQQDNLSTYRYPNAIFSVEDSVLYMDYKAGYGRARLMLQHEGRTRSLGRYRAEYITGDAGTAWFTQLDVCAKGEERYSLYRLTLATGKIDNVQPCGRIAQLAWNSDTQQLVVWRLHNGGSAIELLDHDGNSLQTLAEFGYDTELASLAWHPSAPERVLVNLKPNRSSNFNLYDLHTGSQQWTQLTDNAHIYHDAHWHNDTTVVYSRKAGAFLQAFAWDTAQGTEQQLTRVTQNVLNPRWQADGRLDFITEYGFYYQRATIEWVPSSPSMVQSKALDATPVSLAKPETPAAPAISHPYLPIEHIKPDTLSPSLSYSKESGLEIGAAIELGDPTMRHTVVLSATAGTGNVELEATALYLYNRNNHTVGGLIARQAMEGEYLSGYAFFYDNHSLLSRNKAVGGSVAVFGSQRLEENAVETDRWLSFSLGHVTSESNFNRLRPNQRTGVGLTTETDLSQLENLRVQAQATGYLSLLRHHGMSLRAQARYTTNADEPFQAGSVADTSVISRPIATGFGLQGLQSPLADELLFSGLSFVDISLARPNRTLGTWGLGVRETTLRPYAATVANVDGEVRGNLGALISTEFTRMWLMPVELSVGYAHDWDNLDKKEAGRWFFGLSL